MYRVNINNMDHSFTDMDELLRSHQVDEPIVIETMVGLYRSSLYHLALSILQDSSDADDIVQDTFIDATFHLDRYTPGTNFKAWLFRIAVNNCRGYLRKRRTRQNLELVLKTLHIVSPQMEPDPEKSTLDKDLASRLWAEVGRLNSRHQLVIILRIQHELPISEIAYILEVNEKTVYTRLYDAFRLLRKSINSSSCIDDLAKESPQ